MKRARFYWSVICNIEEEMYTTKMHTMMSYYRGELAAISCFASCDELVATSERYRIRKYCDKLISTCRKIEDGWKEE